MARVVLPAGSVIRVAAGAREPHLQELSRHIHADIVACAPIRDERFPECDGRRPRDLRRLEAPERQELALVRLGDEHTLLAATDAVALGLFPEVDTPIGVGVRRRRALLRQREPDRAPGGACVDGLTLLRDRQVTTIGELCCDLANARHERPPLVRRHRARHFRRANRRAWGTPSQELVDDGRDAAGCGHATEDTRRGEACAGRERRAGRNPHGSRRRRRGVVPR
jgi:hypothetical protein